MLLGGRLIENGEVDLGRMLIANGYIHDNSKFYGIEWEYLNCNEWPFPEEKRSLFEAALHQHVTTNKHHPEYWGAGGIEEMPRLYLAEMTADWKSRSAEQGSDLMEWVKEKATKKFHFSTSGRVYKELKDFIELLLEKRFR